ncbi:hypothetical protein K474DRAFT_1594151 [Panus rudis PR-1116 ss-1]|nr:hypothetical protein K474DRAFT_1594151 [Panus rudis PR-1116 ss-1]
MNSRLQLDVLCPDSDQATLPFRLQVVITFSMCFPGIRKPIVAEGRNAQRRVTEQDERQRRIISYLFPDETPPPAQYHGSTDISLLFSIVHGAPSLQHPQEEMALQPVDLVSTLLPFQRRSVAWLLSREGKRMTAEGDLIPIEDDDDSTLPLFWHSSTADDGSKVYYNRILGEVSVTRPVDNSPPGGILAEEPGLGKTLECISLILLNPAVGRNPDTKTWDPIAKIDVKEVPTTLIVTPVSLAQQWVDEIAQHAPTLKVLVYDGWAKIKIPITETELRAAREAHAIKKVALKSKAKRKAQHKYVQLDDSEIEMAMPEEEEDDGIMDWCTYVSQYDVCITTYNVLQQDLGVARPPPDRPRRKNVKYENIERTRSPLIMCEWYRVIMDEVQMVGGGKTEQMVSLIPRLSSFAVSGTPARATVNDLIHVMKFLRVEEVIDHPKTWPRLLRPGFINEFVSLFDRYCIRTMKAAVKDELTIPKQTRFLVPIELGRVERHVYDQAFERALLELGLDYRGVAVTENWQVDTGVLRTWLRKLRGICTHPLVGQLATQHEKLHKPGVLKTIGEVLETMREQNWRNLMEDRRNKIQAHTYLVQLQQHDQMEKNRYQKALDILLVAEKEALSLIDDINSALTEHAAKGKILKAQAAESRAAAGQDANHNDSATAETMEAEGSKGKGKARADDDATSIGGDSVDSEDIDLPKNAIGEEHGVKKRALQARLREAQITLHKVYFLKGDLYHVLGESHADAENEAYAAAEGLRRVLLKSTEEAAKRAMAQLAHDAAMKGLQENELYVDVPYFGKGGIRSTDLMEEANGMIVHVLNKQSKLLWQWRSRLVALLTQPLTSEDDADGQEYTRSLETQGEAETYLQAYAALLADRRESLTAERTILAAHEVKEKKSRKGRSNLLLGLDDKGAALVDDMGPEPEQEVLLQELTEARKRLMHNWPSNRAVRSVMVELNNVAARIAKEDDPEKIIAKDAASRLRKLILEQNRFLDKLQNDLTLFRKAFNERISYFRQLQELSDTVAEAEWEGPLEAAMEDTIQQRTELEKKIVSGTARQRYLNHLARSQEEGTTDEDEDCCILCRCEFTRGYITQCAHVFCETCMKEWLVRKEGKACPVCRVAINPDQLQRFAVSDPNINARQQARPTKLSKDEPTPRSRRDIRYNIIDPGLLESIELMESHGSYGSKIQTLVRHLLYIQAADPGSKTIVFSAWADSLHIIEHALRNNDIPCLRIDQNSARQNAAKRFRTDPAIQVLLLHGERENAGLNVTCASRVILVESVVNHAFEAQAIARIDRMGQTRPTEVYCYYAEETVERNILDLAAKQGLSLYTQDNAAGTLSMDPLTASVMPADKKVVDAPTRKIQKGDFVFKTDDMLAIFFPHLFEDIEYLLPPDEAESPTVPRRADHRTVNAVARPSRLG